jgi:hypothetical protein
MLSRAFLSMITKELIKQLQKLVDEHEPHIEVMGEHEIMIDIFERTAPATFQYSGFSPYIIIEPTSDGVYHVLTAFSDAQPPKKVKE